MCSYYSHINSASKTALGTCTDTTAHGTGDDDDDEGRAIFSVFCAALLGILLHSELARGSGRGWISERALWRPRYTACIACCSNIIVCPVYYYIRTVLPLSSSSLLGYIIFVNINKYTHIVDSLYVYTMRSCAIARATCPGA